MLPREIVAREGDHGLEPGTWYGLGRSDQALLPVLLRHFDGQGEAWPSEGRLAAMSGLTRKSVREAANRLRFNGIIDIERRVTRAGRRAKRYVMSSPDESYGVPCPSIFIDGGNWSELTPAARALVIPMRFFARPRPDLDPDYSAWPNEDEWGEYLNEDEWGEYLGERNFDYCKAEPAVLREFAGIGPRVYKAAIKSLVDESFIEPAPEAPDTWRIMIWPRRVKKVAYLNAKLRGEKW